MDCLEFRRLAGADPQHPEAAVLEHAAGCPRCAGYLRQTLELDRHVRTGVDVVQAVERVASFQHVFGKRVIIMGGGSENSMQASASGCTSVCANWSSP